MGGTETTPQVWVGFNTVTVQDSRNWCTPSEGRFSDSTRDVRSGSSRGRARRA